MMKNNLISKYMDQTENVSENILLCHKDAYYREYSVYEEYDDHSDHDDNS